MTNEFLMGRTNSDLWMRFDLLYKLIREAQANEDDRVGEPIRQCREISSELVRRDLFATELEGAKDDWLMFKHEMITEVLEHDSANGQAIKQCKMVVAEISQRGLEIKPQVVSLSSLELHGTVEMAGPSSGGG